MARTAANTSAKESYQTVNLPVYLPLDGSQWNGITQFIKNGIISSYENKLTNKVGFLVAPRMGTTLTDSFTTTFTDNLSRGIFYWDKTSKIYSLFADTLTHNTIFTDTPTALTTGFTGAASSYNFAHFTEYFDGTNYFLVVKKTNPTSKAYTIDTSNTLTEITDAQYPNTTAIGAFVAMDGYIFVMTNTGQIWNSDLSTPTSWLSTSFITAQISADRGVGLAKYKNQIVALGLDSIEFFYNAANPTGSPLARTEQAAITGIGCADAKTIIEISDTVYWVGAGPGAVGVYMLDNFKPKKISTPAIDSFISLLENNTKYLFAGSIHIQGTPCYYFSHAIGGFSYGSTFVYNPALDLWMTWGTETGTTYSPFVAASQALVPSSHCSANAAGATIFPTIGNDNLRKIVQFRYGGATADAVTTAGPAFYEVLFELNTRPLEFDTENYVRIHKVTIKLIPNLGTTATSYSLPNLGRFKNPSFSIKQAGYNTAVTFSINGGTEKTIIPAISYPVFSNIEIQYSICEH